MQELQTGLWWWEAVHPEWTAEDTATAEWGLEVSSYAIDDGKRLLMIDPTAPPSPVDALAAERETVIVLTCPWHRRDAGSLAERLGASLYVPPPDEGDPNPVDGHVFAAGDRLPIGVEAFPGMEPNDLVLWIESRRALVAGDTFIDRGKVSSFLPTGRTRASRPSRSSRRCARCSNCRSSSCSRRTERRPTERPSNALFPKRSPRPGRA